MKKIIAFLLVLVTAIPVFAGCKNSDSDKLKIITTIFPYYDVCKNITGDEADITLLIPAGGETHDFEPTPQDIVDINKADVFIYNGGESDEWVENILESVDSDVVVLKMFDFAKILNEQDINHKEGDEADEHIWTSLSNMKMITEAISKNLQAQDKANAEKFQSSTEDYLSRLSKLDKDYRSMIDGAKRKTMVVADRFPLLYFVNEYGLDYVSAFPGCSSETQPSIKTVKRITDYINDNNIPVIFHMDNTNESLAKTISDETGAKVGTFYSCHNVTKEQFEDGTDYISLMELNLKALKEALY